MEKPDLQVKRERAGEIHMARLNVWEKYTDYHMWHDMDPFQQKILGVVGFIIFGYFLFTLTLRTGVLKNFPDLSYTILILILILVIGVGFLMFTYRLYSFVRKSHKAADEQQELFQKKI
ncbi:MAG: hypothetical protein WCX63_05570 [Methanoregula sp.]|jgi:hypothetical protein